jgi:hypothetical protein
MRKITLLVLAVSVVAVAGCGGGGSSGGSSSKPLTKAEYQAKLEQIAKDVGAGISSTTNSKTISKDDIDKLVTALSSFVDKLKDVNPPAEIKDLHTRLVAAIGLFAEEFPKIAKQLTDTKDPSDAIAALFGAKSIQELAKIQQELKAKGYDLNLNG